MKLLRLLLRLQQKKLQLMKLLRLQLRQRPKMHLQKKPLLRLLQM